MDTAGDDEAIAAALSGLADPEARADLRSRYHGTIDLEDALRWRLDPTALGQGGVRSPAVRADELKLIVFRRPEGPEGERRRDAVAAELRSILAAAAEDSAALDAALREHARWREERGFRDALALSAAHEPEPSRPEPDSESPRRGRVVLGRVALLGGAAILAALTLGAVALVGQPAACGADCVESTDAAAPPSPSETAPSPSPTSTPTSPAQRPPSTPTPPPEDTDDRPNYFDEDIFTMLQVPVDGGPIDFATGTAVVDDYGVPLSYEVADGDVFELIAKRFDLGTDYLISINAVRREAPNELFVGDTINLGATTILTIGDQNGVVYEYTDRLPEPHVPQE